MLFLPLNQDKLLEEKLYGKAKIKDISGKIVGFHGKNGVVRVKFKKGLPGQAIGTTVQLVAQTN